MCWSQKAKQRPDMSKVIESLKKLHKSLSPADKVLNTIDITPVFGVPGDTKLQKLERLLTPRESKSTSQSTLGDGASESDESERSALCDGCSNGWRVLTLQA